MRNVDEKVIRKQTITKYMDGKLEEKVDEIAVEFPFTIHVNGEEFATMVCTPSHLDELLLGFLASEGIIRSKDDIQDFHIDEGKGLCYVTLHHAAPVSQHEAGKRFIGSCCGKSRQFYYQVDVKTAKTSYSRVILSPKECIRMMRELQDSSTLFKGTGGVHNAALFLGKDMIVARSDIGRHNALDKLLGHCLIHHIPVRDGVVAFSGRISSEVLLKAAKIGVGIILSKSAPTNLAIELADDLNITAIGFIRGGGFNIYSHPERVKVTSIKECAKFESNK